MVWSAPKPYYISELWFSKYMGQLNGIAISFKEEKYAQIFMLVVKWR